MLRSEDWDWRTSWLHLAWRLSDSTSVFSDNGLHTASIRSAASKLHSRGAFLHFPPNVQTFLVVTIKSHCFVAQVQFSSMFLWWHSPPRQTHFSRAWKLECTELGDLTMTSVWICICVFIRLMCDSNELHLWIHQVMKSLQSFVEFSRFEASFVSDSVIRTSRKSPVCLHVLQIN